MNKISIIVPVYNTAEYLKRSIDSLLAQRTVDFELILVDDGSQDGSAEICREYAQKHPDRIRFIAAAHGGVSTARNSGLDAATGDWIYFCDSDDRAEPDLCNSLLTRAIETGADVSCCALICDRSPQQDIRTNYPDTGDEVWDRETLLRRGARAYFRLAGTMRGTANSYLPITLFRRDLIERHHIRFIPGLELAEDEAFFLEYYQYAQKLTLSTRVCYHYIASPQSACARFFNPGSPFLRTERQWSILSGNRWRLYDGGIYEKAFPEIREELRLSATYHQAMILEADPELSPSGKRRRMNDLLNITRRDLEATAAEQQRLPAGFRLFRALIHFRSTALLMHFCKLRRIINNLNRRENHA